MCAIGGAGPRQRLDRDVKSLEVVGPIERRNECGGNCVLGDTKLGPQLRIRARRETLRINAVRHLN